MSIEQLNKSESGGNFSLQPFYRKANLKFHQDDIGMMKHKSLGKTTDKIFRMARSEGSVTTLFLFIVERNRLLLLNRSWIGFGLCQI